jgi:hypothetical protein
MACVSYGDEKADLFAPYFESALRILVPVIVLYEVRRILLLRPSRTLAEVFVSEALRREIIAIDQTIALAATAMSSIISWSWPTRFLYAAAQSRGRAVYYVRRTF